MVPPVEEIAVALLEAGACQDCGCPVTTIEQARAHAQDESSACEDWNEGEGHNRLTVFREDGTYVLVMINADDEG
jgi:hypothetical protein